MIIKPQKINLEKEKFYFENKVEISLCDKLDAEYIKSLLCNFTFNKTEFIIKPTEKFVLTVNNENASYDEKYEYSISVKNGIGISAKDEISLLHGIYTLLDLISYDEKGIFVQNCQIFDKPKLRERIIHLCVFPETSLDFVLRTIKVCGFLKYSHIIVEFWGMLKYKCHDALGWQNAFEEKEAKLLEETAEKAGIEIIPMFNCLGHASQSRLCTGKHVMLDQSPQYYDLYEPDGWAWNIDNPKTIEMLSNIRRELCTLFPKSRYFHIGCDEVYSYTENAEKAQKLVKYINGIDKELSEMGRTTLIWGDMLFYRHEFSGDENTYEFNVKDKSIAEIIRSGLNKSITVCDWQYNANNAPYLSSKQLKNEGFNVLTCPFLEFENVKGAIKTSEILQLNGVICTTWHLLNQKYPYILESAKEAWEGVDENDTREPRNIYEDCFSKCASIVRKIDFSFGNYEKCGWLKKQI